MPTFHVTEERLREVGLIGPKDRVERIKEGPWNREGAYYISILQVDLSSGERKEYVLKSPWEVSLETKQGKTPGKGSDLITRHVDRMVKLSRSIRELGNYAVRIEKYDDGTMIQENIVGRDLNLALQSMSSAEARAILARCQEIVENIESKLGLKYVAQAYADSKGLQMSRDFMITPQGGLIMVNLNFVEKSAEDD